MNRQEAVKEYGEKKVKGLEDKAKKYGLVIADFQRYRNQLRSGYVANLCLNIISMAAMLYGGLYLGYVAATQYSSVILVAALKVLGV